MMCPRCGGCLYKEPCSHQMKYFSGPGWMWACINCGNRLDARVLRNRALQQAERIASAAFEALEAR